MKELKKLEAWFVTGSQHLYGPKTLKQVADESKKIAEALSQSKHIPVKVVFKPTLTTPESIYKLCTRANVTPDCIGLITWMHTFSPAKMWIAGLKALQKPFVHLHTQFNRDIPWAAIDMDFMNLNQSAHGGREFGFICTRMRKNRKVIVGHWQDEEVQAKLGIWARAACAWHDAQSAQIARFGDNMLEVDVTEKNRTEASNVFSTLVLLKNKKHMYIKENHPTTFRAVSAQLFEKIYQFLWKRSFIPQGKLDNSSKKNRDSNQKKRQWRRPSVIEIGGNNGCEGDASKPYNKDWGSIPNLLFVVFLISVDIIELAIAVFLSIYITQLSSETSGRIVAAFCMTITTLLTFVYKSYKYLLLFACFYN